MSRHHHTKDCQHSSAYWFAEAEKYSRRAMLGAMISIGCFLFVLVVTIIKAVAHG